MRSPHYALCLCFLVTLVTHAQELNRTDAQRDGLAGPVKSVSSKAARTTVKWQQPGGPTLVIPIWCMDCNYDRDGSKTKSGQVVDGTFLGQIIRVVRDGKGQVIEKFTVNVSSGELNTHEVVGPFGKTEETDYIYGSVHWRQTYRYDQYGNNTDWLTFDSAGTQVGRVLTDREPDGTLKEKSVWGEDGQLNYRQTFDPVTKVEHFTTFDQFGLVKLTWTVVAGGLASFWEPQDSLTQYGDNFTETNGNGDAENYACHNDGKCDISRVHYEYLNPKERNPISAEWRDSDGNLRFAAYYDYEIDSFRNWTYRRVWVWSRDLGGRMLYETDSRKIEYWQ